MKIATTMASIAEEIIEETGKNDCSNSIIVDETINNISITIVLSSIDSALPQNQLHQNEEECTLPLEV